MNAVNAECLEAGENAMFFDHFETPLGLMEVCATGKSILSVFFVQNVEPVKPNKLTDAAKIQLQEYFSGDRLEFDLPLEAKGTKFQQEVWNALEHIEQWVLPMAKTP